MARTIIFCLSLRDADAERREYLRYHPLAKPKSDRKVIDELGNIRQYVSASTNLLDGLQDVVSCEVSEALWTGGLSRGYGELLKRAQTWSGYLLQMHRVVSAS